MDKVDKADKVATRTRAHTPTMAKLVVEETVEMVAEEVMVVLVVLVNLEFQKIFILVLVVHLFTHPKLTLTLTTRLL